MGSGGGGGGGGAILGAISGVGKGVVGLPVKWLAGEFLFDSVSVLFFCRLYYCRCQLLSFSQVLLTTAVNYRSFLFLSSS